MIATNKLRWIATTIAASAFIWGDVADAAAGLRWATGAALRRKLAEPVDILWANVPLRQAIRHLSQARRVAILIDRRVDPGRKLNISLKGVPLESALQMIARRYDLGVSQLGDVVYLGPPQTAERLRTVAAALEKDIRRLPPAMQRKYFRSKRLAWDDLATPRDLLVQLGRENRLKFAGLDQVPHDLWAAADLPAISLANRLTLIAVQFDLTFKVADGGMRLELVSVPKVAEITLNDLSRFWSADILPAAILRGW